MFADIFINRPRLAMVIAIIITLAGTIALLNIPVAQYPDITPPTVQVTASYPGADAQTLAETVAAPIEQQVNGVEGMIYMASTTSSSGLYTLTVTFAVGTDPDIAQVNVQNRVALATPQLPDAVTRLGVNVRAQQPNFLLITSVFSPNGTRDGLFLSNYCADQCRQPDLARRRRRLGHADGRAQLFDAHLARSAAHGGARHHRRRRDQRDPAAERAGRRRPDRRAADPRRPGAAIFDHRARPARTAPTSSPTSSSAPARPAASCACATSPASSSARKPTPPSASSTASRPRRWRSISRRARMRLAWRRPSRRSSKC